MTSTASSKGDVGAEMLSSQIGAYFDLAIRIIEYHGGDVVKVSSSFFSLLFTLATAYTILHAKDERH
jgi:class 3 adenylate cyclase